jgi:single-strand DNA-binding protein
MNGVNKVFLIGTAGKDAELKVINENFKSTTFSLATSRYWKNKAGEKQEETEWHNIVINVPGMNETAANYIKKGTNVHIEGRIKTRMHEKDGVKKFFTEIIAESFTLLPSANKPAATNTAAAATATNATASAAKAGSKAAESQAGAYINNNAAAVSSDDFIGSMPAGAEDDLPF